jgi:hypothetical protein
MALHSARQQGGNYVNAGYTVIDDEAASVRGCPDMHHGSSVSVSDHGRVTERRLYAPSEKECVPGLKGVHGAGRVTC